MIRDCFLSPSSRAWLSLFKKQRGHFEGHLISSEPVGARGCHADKNQHWFQLPEQLRRGRVGEGLEEVWQGGSKGPSDSME